MLNEYSRIIQERADHVFEVMAKRVSSEDMPRIRAAFELAREAHAPQRRKTGEPYIFHPIAVANIAAEELMLGANPVIACFLHDVVEDTPYTIDDIRDRFGDDVVSVDYKADETALAMTWHSLYVSLPRNPHMTTNCPSNSTTIANCSIPCSMTSVRYS